MNDVFLKYIKCMEYGLFDPMKTNLYCEVLKNIKFTRRNSQIRIYFYLVKELLSTVSIENGGTQVFASVTKCAV